MISLTNATPRQHIALDIFNLNEEVGAHCSTWPGELYLHGIDATNDKDAHILNCCTTSSIIYWANPQHYSVIPWLTFKVPAEPHPHQKQMT
ncbi:unnamed protein product [Soboliphyme baturini]|uniref:HECW_N domain-containing protein n=1 Tax=Soboliphyme baturini TaxID=241478 RepID=A0A183J220_9BILA|nr:unnamed protein product [Soboliphyme baturini]